MLRLTQKYAALLTTLAVVANLAVLGSCGEEATAPKKDVLAWIQEGWQQFEAKRYADAAISFNNALNLNPADSVAAIAYCGIGWSQGRLRNEELAYNNFSFSIQKDSTSPGPYVVDAYVGRAGVLHKMNLYKDAITDAKKALNLNGTYEFSHDPTIKLTDLHFLMPEAYYHTLQYQKAQEKVDFLRNLLALAAINWSTRPVVVAGVSYVTYQEALLKAIESLRARV